MHLPRDLLNIIWIYAYNINTEKHPLDDVSRVLDIQRAVPPIFLKMYVPTTPIFPTNLGFFTETQKAAYVSLYTENPYRAGNPYFPSNALCENTCPWSYVPIYMVNTMSRKALKTLHTYPAILLRRTHKLFHNDIDVWNESYQRLWSNVVFLDPKNFVPNNWLDRELIHLTCSQLALSQYF